ncbi:hypothetical protein [Brevibacillus choshinensis]|uniref:hypothetical protein n=1 Tax=Brevibacillus choshinensis TaxID=54911 RepID=UPI002E22ACD9|nr:hypothetical protein [Brevibacillus choshinensis]
MTKTEVKNKLNESLQTFASEIESAIETSSFDWKQQDELRLLMKQVFYTLSDFQKVIESIAD